MGHLTGKTAIITGGGRAVLSDGRCGSIGYGIATAYAKEGCNLVLTGRNMQKLEDAKEELERLYGIEVLAVQADVSAGADNVAVVNNVVKQAIDKFGRIDVLINNAGMGIGGCIELATDEEIALQMNTNFMGMANMCKAVLPIFRKQRSGKIINISSIGGVMGLPYQGFYSASKFAIEGYSEALAAEMKGMGIRVVLVEPGDFSTNFTSNRKNSDLTFKNIDYGKSFNRVLKIIEKEENGGLEPIVLAKRIEKIIEKKNPRFRYVVANMEQRLSVLLKKILPANMFIDILRGYYKV